MDNPTELKRQQLNGYIESEVCNESAVQAIVAIGSVAIGTAGVGSDIDAVVFLDPLDLYAVPAEFQWHPISKRYHGIFVEVEGAIQLDFKRVSLTQWAEASFAWPEPMRLELASGWIAYDRNGTIADLINLKTAYTETARQERLDRAIIQLDLLLGGSTPHEIWHRFDPATAHDRLNDAYEHLVTGIFAYNKVWRTWRSREQSYLKALSWLPTTFRKNANQIVVPPSNDFVGYEQRAKLLYQCHEELLHACQSDSLYGDNPVGEAFVRTHEEPGRDWNITEWVEKHVARRR